MKKIKQINPVQKWLDSLSDLEHLELVKVCGGDDDKIWIVFKNKELFHSIFNKRHNIN